MARHSQTVIAASCAYVIIVQVGSRPVPNRAGWRVGPGSVYGRFSVGAVIPARNEESNIGPVVEGLLSLTNAEGGPVMDDIVVCDNGSSDATGKRARSAGARVVEQATPGYGIACLTALRALRTVDFTLFTDGDQSFKASQALRLLDRLTEGADLAIGSRVLGTIEPGALSMPQWLGNRLASTLMRLLWGERVTDLGPYRAIRSEALRRIRMQDLAYGWTVEMQVKAVQHRLRIAEVPVDTARRRSGSSKVGGSVHGVIGAANGILGTIVKLRLQQAHGASKRSSSGSGKQGAMRR